MWLNIFDHTKKARILFTHLRTAEKKAYDFTQIRFILYRQKI